jgi:hypothetical protein
MADDHPTDITKPVKLNRRRTTHGKSKSRLYRVWTGLKQRCHNPKSTAYKDYGARGITVCDRWRASFEAFSDDIGPDPGPEFEIDRIDNSKGYSPDNWRWATRVQQMANTRNNRYVAYQGRTQMVSEWAKEIGVGLTTLTTRLDRWGVEKALSARGPQTRATSPSENSKCRWITFNGETRLLTEWAKITGISRFVLHWRIKKWGIEKVFTYVSPKAKDAG